MRYLFLSVLVVCMIGIMIPSGAADFHGGDICTRFFVNPDTCLSEEDRNAPLTRSIEVGAYMWVAIGATIVVIIVIIRKIRRKDKKWFQSKQQELDEYEEQYLTKPKPVKQKHVEKKETSAFCENCGKSLRPTAKFCGSCGNQV